MTSYLIQVHCRDSDVVHTKSKKNSNKPKNANFSVETFPIIYYTPYQARSYTQEITGTVIKHSCLSKQDDPQVK